jgi:cytochrome c-type biogenesis protein CcmH
MRSRSRARAFYIASNSAGRGRRAHPPTHRGLSLRGLQNQSLADSNAPLAADLRARIREQVQNGASDDDIRAYMVRRYGDFVLYRPPMKAATLALWFGPLAALALGGIALASCVRRAGRKRTRKGTRA